MKNRLKKHIGRHWSRVSKKQATRGNLKLRWWQSPTVHRYISRLLNKKTSIGGGIQKAVRRGLLPCQRAISVGCGTGQKEIDLLNKGLVQEFHLYELSEERINQGRDIAKQHGVEGRVTYYCEDAFESVTYLEQFDLVYWNNSLHHMFDVDAAIKWSRDVLKLGGTFYMDDFIGASRFQWSDEELALASKVRRCFEGTRYLKSPLRKNANLRVDMVRPTVEGMIAADPSEAADSGRIIDCLGKHFPNIEITYTGGAVYNSALHDMLHNIDEENEQHILNLLLLIDEMASKQGLNHYAIAMCQKV